MKNLLLKTAAAAVAAISLQCMALDFPTKRIELQVGAAAGGYADILGRAVAERLSVSLGQPVIVVNTPGSAGIAATMKVKTAAPDGYTLQLAFPSTHVLNALTIKNLPYDPVRDFTPIAFYGRMPNVLIVNNDLPVNSVQELIAYAKRRPGTLNYASNALGSSSHLTMELFKAKTGTDIVHVPYKGSSEAALGLLGGSVSVMFDNLQYQMPQIKAGKVKVLGVTAKERSVLLPNIPTMQEAGVPDLVTDVWFGFVAPAGTPRDIVDLLNRRIRETVKSPEIQERLRGMQFEDGTPEQFGAFIKSEIERWRAPLAAAGLLVQ